MEQKDELNSEGLEEGQIKEKDVHMNDEQANTKINPEVPPNKELYQVVSKLKANWRKFNPFEPSQFLQGSQKQNAPRKTLEMPVTRAVQVDQEMYPHKQSLLPAKRSFYGSLYKGDLNRFAQCNPPDGAESLYIEPKQI